jgi:spermidine synthase
MTTTAIRRAVSSPAEAAVGARLATAFAFVGSGCLLVLELVAARLVAPIVGVSLYTWTSVIGVVLAGVAIGNYAGGRVADRWPSRSALGLIYVAASGASLAVLAALHFAPSLTLPSGTPALLQVLWLTALLFLVPSTILGAPTPLLTRLSLDAVEHGGRVVGRIQAAAALGSIAGAFLTGFLLVSWLGTRHVVAGIAAVLLALAVLSRPPWLRGRVLELGSLAAVILASGWASHSGCVRESNYYCIDVTHGVENGTPYRGLVLDHLLNGIVNVEDPTKPVYSYERFYAAALDQVYQHGARVDAFLLGGGAYTFPSYLRRTYRGKIVVAEIDPEVTSVARRYLGFRDSPRIRIVTGDARRTLRLLPADEKFDLVFGDAFNDFEVPYQLTTREFHELVARHLKPNGLYLLNVVDGERFDFLRSEVRTLRLTFPYVGVMAFPFTLPPDSKARNTFVVIASKRPPAHRLPVVLPHQLRGLMQSGHSVVLTDDHVPVDQLLAPVFSQALHGG